MAGLLADQLGQGGHQLHQSLLLSALDEQAPSVRDAASGNTPGESDVGEPVDPKETRRSAREVYLSFVREALRPTRMRRLYGQIRCPVLQIHGEDDPNVPVGWAYAAAQRYDDWTVEVYPGVSHVVKMQNPRWWYERVAEFVRSGAPVSRA